MRVVTAVELVEILRKHKAWLNGEKDGERADLSGADLYGANLSGADLSRAYLSGADLSGADLSGADLSGADLSGAYLSGANLYGANLYGANLYGAYLYGAYLSRADLSGANLYGANLYGAYLSRADLSGANHVEDAKNLKYPIACPEKGSFIGFKKTRGGYIVELEIPEDALRCSATSRKCRCSKAKVLSITNFDGTPADIDVVYSSHDQTFVYRVGDIVEPDSFDPNRWHECAPGIHFFITRQEAVDY